MLAPSRPILEGEVSIWHDPERKTFYVVAEGPFSEECLRAEGQYYADELKECFMTGDFAILCRIQKNAGMTLRASQVLKTFVTETLNTRYLPVCIAFVSSPGVDGYFESIPILKRMLGDITPFASFFNLAEAEDWIAARLEQK